MDKKMIGSRSIRFASPPYIVGSYSLVGKKEGEGPLSCYFDEIEEAESADERGQEKTDFNENLYRSVDELELSVRSANCLKNADIKYIGELVQKTEQEILMTKNFGRKSLNEIKEILSCMGLRLGLKLDSFPAREELDKMVLKKKDHM